MPNVEAIAALAVPMIKHFEGCELTAYPDPATHADPWTIGYGATGSGIARGTVWTQEQADADLAKRVAKLVVQVTSLVTAPLKDEGFAALVSLSYNIGISDFEHSSIRSRLNVGDYAGAARTIDLYCHAAGHTMPALVARRALEKAAFLRGGPGGVA